MNYNINHSFVLFTLLLIVICNIFVLLSLEINNEAQFRQSNDRPDRIQ